MSKDLPKMNLKQQQTRINITELVFDMKNFELTYAEINAALIRVLENNNKYELQELWK